MKHDPPALLTPSEIGQFAFCRRAWWLGAVEGQTPANREALEAGAHVHRRHYGRVRGTAILARLAYLLIAAGVVGALLLILRGG